MRPNDNDSTTCVGEQMAQRSVTNGFLRYINILTYLLTYLLVPASRWQ